MTQEFVTLPREVVEQALEALLNEGNFRKLRKPLIEESIKQIKAALEQPQRKLTAQDIADSALLGNIESQFNACMHQEHCKRWKAQADQHAVDHQRESSSDNDLPSENGQSSTTSSSVPFGYKLVPLVPTVEMMDAGGAATRRCYQHLNKDEVMCSYVYRHMLAAAPGEDGDTINALRAAVQQACDWISEEPGRRPISAGRLLAILTNALAAAPQPPALEQQVEKESTCKDSLQVEQEPVAWIWTEWSKRKLTFDGPPAVPSVRDELTKPVWTPLYTQPQPAQKPLTDVQVLKAVRHLYQSDLPVGMGFSDDLDVARAIEAAHNIK